jgi:4'-phosphopantetheinyl transferase
VSIAPISWPGPSLLWRVDLDAAPTDAASLSEAERARAARFVFPRDGQRYVAAHVALREILSTQTGIAPEHLAFTEGEFGKPSLAGQPAVHFNLSHSHSIGLIAVSHGAEVGVDVELARSVSDAMALAATCFTPGEIRMLQATPVATRDRAFLIGWTRKEAAIKALGLGMSADLQSLEVGLETAEREVQCCVGTHMRALQVFSIPLGEGVLGALALDPVRPGGHAASARPSLLLEALP